MSRFKIVNLIDKIFVSVAIFLLVYAWVNFYIRNLFTTFIISLIVSFAIIFVLYYILEKREYKFQLTKQEKDKFLKTILAFRLLPKKEKQKMLADIIEKSNGRIIDQSHLTFVKDEKTHIVLLATNIEQLTNNDIVNLIDSNLNEKVDVIDIICNDISLNIKTDYLKTTTINLIDKNKFYNDYILKYGINIDLSDLDNSINKIKFKDILRGMFLPFKARSYFICGLILIFSSILLPYHAYYLIFGSMFMLFSIICKILPKFTSH